MGSLAIPRRLQPEQLRVPPAQRHQHLVRTLLQNRAIPEHQNPVRHPHRGKPVGDQHGAIYALEAERGQDGSPARRASETRNQTKRDQAAAFETGVPYARVVRLGNAGHDVLRSNGSEVLPEILHDFITRLPKSGDRQRGTVGFHLLRLAALRCQVARVNNGSQL